jgi:hypothetical protein
MKTFTKSHTMVPSTSTEKLKDGEEKGINCHGFSEDLKEATK